MLAKVRVGTSARYREGGRRGCRSIVAVGDLAGTQFHRASSGQRHHVARDGCWSTHHGIGDGSARSRGRTHCERCTTERLRSNRCEGQGWHFWCDGEGGRRCARSIVAVGGLAGTQLHGTRSGRRHHVAHDGCRATHYRVRYGSARRRGRAHRKRCTTVRLRCNRRKGQSWHLRRHGEGGSRCARSIVAVCCLAGAQYYRARSRHRNQVACDGCRAAHYRVCNSPTRSRGRAYRKGCAAIGL